MRGIEPPLFREGRFQITIETEGRLPLPPELIRPLGLTPGDIVALKLLEGLEGIIRNRFYRQILTFPWEALSLAIRWSFTVELLRLPLTALDAEGALVVPPEVMPLPAGARTVLTVTDTFGASWPSLYLSQRAFHS